jgi:transposase
MVRNYKRKTLDRWSTEDLLSALQSIHNGTKMSEVVKRYPISRATLYRQMKKFMEAGGKTTVSQLKTSGRNSILSRLEETLLEKTVTELIEQGCNVEVSDIKKICFEYCETNNIRHSFDQTKRMASDDWYYGFLKRNPSLSYFKKKVRKTKSNVAKKSSSSTAEGSSSSSLSDSNDEPVTLENSVEVKEEPEVGENVSLKGTKKKKNGDKNQVELMSVRKKEMASSTVKCNDQLWECAKMEVP